MTLWGEHHPGNAILGLSTVLMPRLSPTFPPVCLILPFAKPDHISPSIWVEHLVGRLETKRAVGKWNQSEKTAKQRGSEQHVSGRVTWVALWEDLGAAQPGAWDLGCRPTVSGSQPEDMNSQIPGCQVHKQHGF